MKVNLCKPVPGGMTEQEKAEAGLLYNPNVTEEMKAFRFAVQDKIWEYNQLKPSQVRDRRDRRTRSSPAIPPASSASSARPTSSSTSGPDD